MKKKNSKKEILENKRLGKNTKGVDLQKSFKWASRSEKDQLDFIDNFPKIAISDIKKRAEGIKKIKSADKNFDNTALAYENISDDENIRMGQIHALEMCSDSVRVRESCRKAEVQISSKMVDIAYDIDLYKSIKDYYDKNYKKDINNKTLGQQDIKLVEDMMKDFARMGFELDIKSRNKIKIIEKKISKLANSYDARLSEDKSHILCTKEEMDGVPENIINSFRKINKQIKNKKSKNHEEEYVVGVEYPEYGPFMKYAKDRKKREELYVVYNNIGGMKNVKILEELVSLRQEKAEVLGHINHGEYVVSDRMAKNTSSAYKMINDVLDKLKNKKESDLKEILTKAAELGIEKSHFKTSDMDYVVNKIREEKYAYDEQELREYFPLDHVVKTMFEIFGELFGFVVVVSDIKLWHKDAKLYELRNIDDGLIGHMAMDLFPREGKFGHACMLPIVTGKDMGKNSPYRSGVVALICNFSKPSNKAKSKIPSLLTLGEVETLYHEFGHGLHSLLSRAKYTSQSGTNVVWDFVETPSQIMEEWVTEEKILSRISKHYITGKSLSKNFITKIKSLDKFMKGLFYTRHCLNSLLDLDIYTDKLQGRNMVQHYHKLAEKYIYKQTDKVIFVSRFAHIARGYDAGYYSYMWAERISKDIYGEFKKRISNKKDYKEFGSRYRKEILEIGSSRDENESIRILLGRETGSKNFVEGMI